MANWLKRRAEKAVETLEQFIWGALIVSGLGAIWYFFEGSRGAPMLIAIGFFSAVILSIVAALILKSFKSRPTPTNELREIQDLVQKIEGDLNVEHEKLVEGLQKETELLKTEHQREIRGRDAAFDTLKKDYEILRQQNEGLNLYVTQHSWLHNIASTQARDIDHYVTQSEISLGDIFLNNEVPHIKFGLHLLNDSLFDVTVELEKKGYIIFRERELYYEVKIVSDNHPIKINPLSESRLVIEQPLTEREAHYISSSEAVEDATFYFDRLVITIKGGRYQTDDIRVPQKPLWINKSITLKGKLITSRR